MTKIEESLNQISLKDLLNPTELNTLKQYSIFKNAEENEFSFDKNELLLKFIFLAIQKFKELKEDILTKCFEWVKKELEMNLELKPDALSLNKIEKMEKSKPSMKIKLGWLKEYSSLSKENHLYSMIGKNLKKLLMHQYSLSSVLIL